MNEKRARQIEFLRSLPPIEQAVEVGVHRGAFSKLILEHLGPRELTLIDPWTWAGQWFAEHSQTQREQLESGASLDEGEALYREVYEKFADDARVRVLRCGSVEGAAAFDDAALDWVFIDGDHRYEPVKEDLHAWWPKLRPGGLLSGDDFWFETIFKKNVSNGVSTAVHEFVRDNALDLDLRRLKASNAPSGAVNYMFTLRKPDVS